MKHIRFILALTSLSLVFGCSHGGQTKPGDSALDAQKVSPQADTPASMEGAAPAADSTRPLDPTALKKAKPLFEAIARGDDKKAKLAYGRAVRHLPEIVQFAVDLRFRNYEHALTVLPKTSLAPDQKEFWQRVIAKKPPRLGVALCSELVLHPEFPAAGARVPEDEAAWVQELGKVAQSEVEQPKERSEINQQLDKVVCGEKDFRPETGNCGPMSEDVREELLKDSFFDQIHNMKRRDTRFWQSNYKSILKLTTYHPYVSDMGLLKFYRALKATPFDKQMHFLRRFNGIARDMRSETILSRSIAATILGDDEDKALARRLGAFLTSNSLISAITRVEGEIPGCHVPETKLGAVSAPEVTPEPSASVTPTATSTPAPTPEASATPSN